MTFVVIVGLTGGYQARYRSPLHPHILILTLLNQSLLSKSQASRRHQHFPVSYRFHLEQPLLVQALSGRFLSHFSNVFRLTAVHFLMDAFEFLLYSF